MPLASRTLSVKEVKKETAEFLGIIQYAVMSGEMGKLLYCGDEDVVGFHLPASGNPELPSFHPYFTDIDEVWLVIRPGADGNPPEDFRKEFINQS